MIRKACSVLPLVCCETSKQIPGLRCNCETTTRSAPLTMKEPRSVIIGTSPIMISSSLKAPFSRRRSLSITEIAKVVPSRMASNSVDLGRTKPYSKYSRRKLPLLLSTGKDSRKTASRPTLSRVVVGVSNCRNSLNEKIWFSMRFGGGMTSLSLPKLLRAFCMTVSVERSGGGVSMKWVVSGWCGPDGRWKKAGR